MKKKIDLKNIEQFKPMRNSFNLEDAMKEANRCLLCKDAPCSKGCPAETDPEKFIRQIKFENFKGAARTIRNNNIMGNICAYVCPVEKSCEKECSINALEDPINISALQCFACDYGKKHHLEKLEPGKKDKGKVAIIGAGPAGMSCAYTLAKMGYDVTIFEKETESGGIPKSIIPKYRLPLKAIDDDIQNLTDLGVTIKYHTKIDSQNAILDMLSKQGYQAVFISIGLAEPITLSMLNGYVNAMHYHQFLHVAKNQQDTIQIKDKIVAVIGGGSVAMDAVCTSAALGAKKVYAISLEGLSELPADKEEIEIAHELHIIFKSNSQITNIHATDNKITKIIGKEIEWKTPNNFSPQNAKPIEGTKFNLNVDLIIQAIGTKPDKEISTLATGLKIKNNGLLVVNDDGSTNMPGIFAGGDITNGGVSVAQAIGDGKKTAIKIDEFITTTTHSKKTATKTAEHVNL